MRIRTILTAAAVPAALAAALLGTAGPSAAATSSAAPAAYTATSHLTSRPDSGGSGTWGYDWMNRQLKIELAGSTGTGASTVYYFKASVLDTGGTFATVSGADTPNQASPETGKTINAVVDGTMWGWATYSFTATSLPNMALVPKAVNGSADSTSTWYELAFAPGTTFGGAGIGTWGWYYYGPWIVTYNANGVGVIHYSQERWTDASWNNAGQLAGAGDITGYGA
jgi:hypothetical protein